MFRFRATALMFSYTESKHLSIDSTVNDIFDRLALSWNRCTRSRVSRMKILEVTI